MRKAKKALSVLLAVLIVFSIGIAAFAQEKTGAESEDAVRIVDFAKSKDEIVPLFSNQSREIWEFDYITGFGGSDANFLIDNIWTSGSCYVIALTFDSDVSYDALSAEITGDLIIEANARPYNVEEEPWEPVSGRSVVIVEIGLDANRTAKYRESSITFFVGNEKGCTFNFISDVPIIDPDEVVAAAKNDEPVYLNVKGISSYYYETQGKKVPANYACAISEGSFAAIEGMDLTIEGYLCQSIIFHEIAEGQQGINFYGFEDVYIQNDLGETIECPSLRIRFFDRTPILGRYDIIWDTNYNLNELRTLFGREDEKIVEYSLFKNYKDIKKQYAVDYSLADGYQTLLMKIECENEALGSYMFTADKKVVDHGSYYDYNGYNTISWKFTTDGKLTVSGSGVMMEPSYYLYGDKIFPCVTAAPWHIYAYDIEEIVIENGVEGFGEYTFMGLENAKKITIPESVWYMGYFYSFTTFLNIETAGPSGGGYDCEFGWTENIPRDAFYYCRTLREAVIPEGITAIGEYAFLDCENLEKVIFEGDAPAVFAAGYYGATFSDNIVTLHYYEGKEGWTSPKWNGYNTVMIEKGSKPEQKVTKLGITSAVIDGSSAEVSVTVSESSMAEMIQFTIKYDVEKLRAVSVNADIAEEAEINMDYPGYIYFAWDSLSPLETGGALFNIEFAPANGAFDGEALVEFDFSEEFVFKNEDYEDIILETENGVLTYKGVLYGDINGDTRINILDANIIRRYAARIITLDDAEIEAADVNGDGRVNILDANIIRRYAAKLIDRFPVEY